jgi:hypothetical protein
MSLYLREPIENQPYCPTNAKALMLTMPEDAVVYVQTYKQAEQECSLGYLHS